MNAHVSTGRWHLLPDSTTVELRVKNWLVKTVIATVDVSEGHVDVREAIEESTVSVTVNAGSFSSGNAKRDEHVTGSDFLDAEAHPAITFSGREIHIGPDGQYVAAGELSVRSSSAEVRLLLTDIVADGASVEFSGTTVLDRRELGVSRMPTFMIGNTVEVSVHGKATNSG